MPVPKQTDPKPAPAKPGRPDTSRGRRSRPLRWSWNKPTSSRPRSPRRKKSSRPNGGSFRSSKKPRSCSRDARAMELLTGRAAQPPAAAAIRRRPKPTRWSTPGSSCPARAGLVSDRRQSQQEDDFLFFGFVPGAWKGVRTSFRLSELEAFRGQLGLQRVERDLAFREGRLTDVVPAPDS